MHRAERLGQRRHAVGPVVVVEVDAVGAKPLERRGDRVMDVLPRSAPLHPVPELRREDDPVAPTFEQLAEEALAVAAAVDVGSVEEVDADFERGIDDLACSREVDPPAEVVAAEADARDLEVGIAAAGRASRPCHETPASRNARLSFSISRAITRR